MTKDTRIAISGASGLVASNILAQLKESGYTNIVLLTSDKGKIKNSSEQIIELDLSNPRELAQALTGVEVIFHTAAIVSFSDKLAEQIIERNVDICTHVVDAALECGVSRIIHTSSIAALGGMRPDKIYIDESFFLIDFMSSSPYSRSKFLCENQMLRARELGIDVIIVNPGVIVGEGDSITPLLVRGSIFYSYGVTGYVDVKDVARAQVRLMESNNAWGESFVLVAENLSIKKLVSMGKKQPKIELKPWMIVLAAMLEYIVCKITRRAPKLSPSFARTLFTKSYYNGEKIKKYIDFKYTPIAKTIKRVMQQ